jgi:hypothetical protein
MVMMIEFIVVEIDFIVLGKQIVDEEFVDPP